MTHGCILIKTEGAEYSVELYTPHSGDVRHAIFTVLRLPTAMLNLMLATKAPKLRLLVGLDRPIKGDSAKIYQALCDFCRSQLPFEADATNVANMIISSHFLRWSPMPQTDDTSLLEHYGHGAPDLVVTVTDGRTPTISLGIPELEDEVDFDDLLDDITAEVTKLNKDAAPHTCYQVEGNIITYSFDQVISAIVANRYQEVYDSVKSWNN